MPTLTFAGNLADDPELRYTPNGTPVAEFKVIENRSKRNEAGDWEDDVPNTFRVKAWRSMAENIAESVAKGDRVIVTGKIKTERFNDRETGDPRTATHVDATDVGFSLRFHTVQATKANRTQSVD